MPSIIWNVPPLDCACGTRCQAVYKDGRFIGYECPRCERTYRAIDEAHND